MSYQIEEFYSIPRLAGIYSTDESKIIESIELSGIKVIERSSYRGFVIAASDGNQYDLKLKDHCTYITRARIYPNLNNPDPEKRKGSFDGEPFICKPPYTGMENIGVIEEYHEKLKEILDRKRWIGSSGKPGDLDDDDHGLIGTHFVVGWKAIAAALGVSVDTAKRCCRERGLPWTHDPAGHPQTTIEEISRWRKNNPKTLIKQKK